MKSNTLLKDNEKIVRILDTQNEEVLIIDCISRTMPKWVSTESLKDFIPCTNDELLTVTNTNLYNLDTIDMKIKKTIYNRFTIIAGILPFISNEKERSEMICKLSKEMNISKQTIRNYLCSYLAFQDISILAPKEKTKKKLNQDEKNMRWALNKFFYTKNKNSLPTAYTMMLKEKYCDSNGKLLNKYPSFYQFRYFYRKNKNMQTYYISRNGLKDYQRNNRPLIGNGVQQFAPIIGTGMLDSTVCDIYLINETGNVVGRPILTACVDTYSGLCCGYSLSWEGGMYSIKNLMLNIVTDKVKWCSKLGINIEPEEWDCNELPAIFVTDMGAEYKSENFEQITELGVKIINLPSYRPELKGSVEKFFDLIQDSYKKHLKGKGVVEPDFQERGSHDYRKDACLTIADFEKIIIYCIIYYNNKHIIENFPYTQNMINANVKPYSKDIWQWGKTQNSANLITVNPKQIILTLLPRTTGKFTRYGLKVNKLRYHNENYNLRYLENEEVTVAYNPDDVSNIWLIENGNYIEFALIESRFKDKDLNDVQQLKSQQKEIVKSVIHENLQAQIDLANHISIISHSTYIKNANIKSIRETRNKEKNKSHINYLNGGELYE